MKRILAGGGENGTQRKLFDNFQCVKSVIVSEEN